jgi:hypothetical protein
VDTVSRAGYDEGNDLRRDMAAFKVDGDVRAVVGVERADRVGGVELAIGR